MNTPIDYLTTPELINELRNRFDEMVFIGYRRKNKEDNYVIRVKASVHGTYGLLEVLRNAADSQEGTEE
jgi:hypothetical protein